MSRAHLTPEQIDAILPQTQCGLCTYGACMPYAKALVHENAAIDLCPPGGVEGLRAIAKLVAEDATPFIEKMQQQEKPRVLAVIREAECIGCVKCITACPVDAILGSAKQMHTVIAAECTGCELCVAPCPVDCIDLVVVNEPVEKERARNRYRARQERLARPLPQVVQKTAVTDKKAFVEAALLRVKAKKNF